MVDLQILAIQIQLISAGIKIKINKYYNHY